MGTIILLIIVCFIAAVVLAIFGVMLLLALASTVPKVPRGTKHR